MTKKISDNQNGYSAIELVLLSVVVIVLASILISAYGGLRIREHNNTRIADMKTLELNLEIFYARSGFYPSLAEINSPTWTSANIKQVPPSDLIDPGSKTNIQLFTQIPTKTNFGYDVSSSSGSICNNKTVACNQYVLSAVLEGGSGTFKEKSLN
jgi:Tfp pilus assembly protein PilE